MKAMGRLTCSLALACAPLIACGTVSTGATPVSTAAALQSTRASVLSASATPEQVVRMYVQALDAHDIARAKTLLTSAHAQEVEGEQDSWFTNVVHISDLRLSEPVPEDGQGTLAQGYSQVIFVPVEFTVTLKAQESMSNGHTVWGYLLARNSDAQRWAIVDEGPV